MVPHFDFNQLSEEEKTPKKALFSTLPVQYLSGMCSIQCAQCGECGVCGVQSVGLVRIACSVEGVGE